MSCKITGTLLKRPKLRMLCLNSTKARMRNNLFQGIVLLVTLLAGCGGGGSSGDPPSEPPPHAGININGKAAIEGTPLTGAIVAISKLDITQASETKSRRGKIVSVGLENFQPTVAADGVFSFQLPNSLLQDDSLYSLSLTCPKPTSNDCPLQTPIHAVLSGSRLKQGGFSVNVLTEVVYQRLGYYIAVGFKAPELQQEMNALGRMLLVDSLDVNTEFQYEDILQFGYSQESTPALRRPGAVSKIANALAHQDENNSNLQLLVQSLFSPITANIKFKVSAGLIEIDANKAYVSSESVLHIIDISDPLNPRETHSFNAPGPISDLLIKGSFLYLIYNTNNTNQVSGLQILDISNPRSQQPLSNIELTGPLQRIAVDGSYAYITFARKNPKEPTGIHIVDLSSASTPRPLSLLNIDDTSSTYDDSSDACGVLVSGRYAYITSNFELSVVDISSPEAPTLLKKEYAGGKPCTIGQRNEVLFLAAEYGGILQFDISVPSEPKPLDVIPSHDLARRLLVEGDKLYVPSARAGLKVISIDDTSSIDTSVFDTPGSAIDVAISGNFAFVTDEVNGLQIVDTSIQVPPPLVGSLEGSGNDVVIADSMAYLLSMWPGLTGIDISSPANPMTCPPQKVGGYLTPFSIVSSGNNLFAATGFSVEIFDVKTAPCNITWLSSAPSTGAVDGEVPSSAAVDGIAIDGNYAYVAASQQGIFVLDVSTPSAPMLVSELDTFEDAFNIAIKDTFAFVADGRGGLKVVNIIDPTDLKPLGTVDTPGAAVGVTIAGDTAYVADADAGLQIVNIKDPSHPTIVGSLDTPGEAREVVVQDGIAYVADDIAGVQVIDVRDERNPILIGSARTHAGAQGIAANKDYVFVATRFGLEILHAIPTE